MPSMKRKNAQIKPPHETAADKLIVHHVDSSILQTYELQSPFMILLETCNEKAEHFSIYYLTPNGHYSQRFHNKERNMILRRPQHQHSFIEVMYVLSGSVTNHVENRTFTYSAGQCCVMNKNIRHCEDFSGEFQAAFFMFRIDFLTNLPDEFRAGASAAPATAKTNPIYQLIRDYGNENRSFEKVYLDCLPVVSPDIALERLNPLFNFLVGEITAKVPGSLFFIKGAFARFFHLLGTPSLYCIDRVQTDSGSQDYLFTKIAHIMEASHGRSTREDLETILHYNGEYLNRIVKKYAGKTILEYGRTIYMEEARKLLLETDLSISAIISELGFSNRSHFYRLFKGIYGETPLEFRNHHTNP